MPLLDDLLIVKIHGHDEDEPTEYFGMQQQQQQHKTNQQPECVSRMKEVSPEDACWRQMGSSTLWTKIRSGNFVLASALCLSGNSYTKVRLMFNFCNLQYFSSTLFNQYIRSYKSSQPSINTGKNTCRNVGKKGKNKAVVDDTIINSLTMSLEKTGRNIKYIVT